MKEKIIQKIKRNKFGIVTSVATCTSLLTGVVAHAEGTGNEVTTALQNSLSTGKADVISCLASVIGIGAGIYLVKFGARQALNFFSMIANKK